MEAGFGVALQHALTDTETHTGGAVGAVLAAEARRCHASSGGVQSPWVAFNHTALWVSAAPGTGGPVTGAR